MLRELFFAQKNKGATVNGKSICVSSRVNLDECIFSTGFACLRSDLEKNNLPYFNTLVPQLRDIRRYGSAALDLCYVAAGRCDAFWELNLNEFDVAAGRLILEEAGGRFSDFSNQENRLYGEVLASNSLVHDKVVDVFKDIRTS